MVIESNCEKETYELGCRLGQEARAGQVYTLVGDLGVGKTVFTKGPARGCIEGAGKPLHFTIVQVYRREGASALLSFDVYRIGDVERDGRGWLRRLCLWRGRKSYRMGQPD